MIDVSSVPYVIKSDIRVNERDGHSDGNTKTEKELLLKGRKRGVSGISDVTINKRFSSGTTNNQ